MKTLILDNKNWQLGSSTDDESDFAGVVGLSPDWKGQNFYKSKGDSLCGQPSLVAMTGLTMNGNVIAGMPDPTTTSRDALIILSNGQFHSTSGTTITNFADDSSHSTEYKKGQTDFKYFKGSFFVTREQGIVKFEPNLTTIDYVWWVTTMGTALNINGPHPMEIVEDTLYIADLNMIHTWDGTTAAYNQFTLPTGYVITALKVHTDGRYLKIFATDTYNYFHADKTVSKLFLVDTLTLEFTSVYELDEQVEGAINYGGTCFLTYGENFGYFDGSGLKLIRKIALSGSAENTITSQLLSIYNNSIMFPSKDYINAYGDVSGKGAIFFFPLALVTGNFLHYILPITNVLCLVQYVDGSGNYKLAQIDLSKGGDLNAQTTKIDVGGRIWIRKVDFYIDSLATSGFITIQNRQDDGSLKDIGIISRTEDGAATKKSFFCNVLTDFIQPFVSGSITSPIKKIHIQYESAE
jgi:hypothetical protein